MFLNTTILFILLIGVSQALPTNIFDSIDPSPQSQLYARVEIVLGRSESLPVSNPILTRVDVPLVTYIETVGNANIGRDPDILRSGEKDLGLTYNILAGRVISGPPRVRCAIFSSAGTIESLLPFDNPANRVNGKVIFCYQLKDTNDSI